MRKILAQISANLPDKESKENDLHKKRLHFTGRIVFKSRQLSTIFAQISPKLAQISLHLPENN